MTTLIIPAAGKSTRFKSAKPKWMKTAPNGELMLVQSIHGIDKTNVQSMFIGVLREHIETHKLNLSKLAQHIGEQGITPEFVVLDTSVSSQPGDVCQIIRAKNITGSIFIKDCDNYFEAAPKDINEVCTSRLQANTNAINKSYVALDKMGSLSGIVEKMVIGDQFCCGGYSFIDAQKFDAHYQTVKSTKQINQGELYISHIIQSMLLDGCKFRVQETTGYLDWGDLTAWNAYCSGFKTIFCDIDGCLVKNGGEMFDPEWGTAEALPNNIATINRFYDTGKVKVILTTARPSSIKTETEQQLSKFGVRYHFIVFDLPHARRFLVNDFAESNPYPSAVAINLKRDGDDLSSYIDQS
jgi:hypothetical protein